MGATSITPVANAAIEPAPVSNPIRTDLARSRRIALPRDAATAVFGRFRKSGVPMNH
nr:K280 [uncultured bacterium]